MADKLTGLVSITEEDAKKFHMDRMNTFPEDDTYHAGYKIAEKVKIDYLLAPVKNFTNDTIVTEEQVKKYYEDHKESYREQPKPAEAGATAEKNEEVTYTPLEKLHANIEGILRRNEGKALATAEADRVSRKIAEETNTPFGSSERKYVDFKDVAKQFRVEYGETDYFAKDNTPGPLLGATRLGTEAFGQRVEAVRVPLGPIDCMAGSFVFELLDIKPARASSLEEVRAKVEQDLKLMKARDLAEATLRDALNKAMADPEFKATSDKQKRPVLYLTGEEAVAALACQGGGRLHSITLGFEELKGSALDETVLADKVAGECGIPAMIGAVQTFGDLIHWHSHVHAIVSEGVFTESGHFVHIPDTWKHRAIEIWVMSLYG
jgi:hypothetical protein